MTTPLVPDGLEPLAVWDATSPEWTRGPFRQRAEWVSRHVGNPVLIYRVAIYLIDAPFAVVDQFVPDGGGFKWAQDGEPVTETVFVPLSELPPAHLLARTP